MSSKLEIFLVCAPGLEPILAQEALSLGFSNVAAESGGVTIDGNWREVWRANLWLRGATRVLVRLGGFRTFHLAQLDKRARKFEWSSVLKPSTHIKVEVTCRKSKIYHSKAAKQRIETALKENGFNVSDDADLVLKTRIQDDYCSFSIDTSGESLHKRGHKQAVNKAPMRENLAAMFLKACGYTGEEPIYDPMCGSGTFVIEAAEIAAGLVPGRSRNFAFEELQTFDPAEFQTLQKAAARSTGLTFYGSDRDQGAILMCNKNAGTAGVESMTEFYCKSISEISAPDGPAGLVIINPPYGGRIGQKKMLYGLYAALGKTLTQNFQGWRVGLITTDADLAKTTKLPFKAPGPFVDHGGQKIRLWQTEKL